MMQPERAHDWHSSLAAFTHRRVEIGHQPITQLEILATDRLDHRIMKLALIRIGGAAGVIRDFAHTQFSGVPTPRQAQMPRSPMRSKEGAESAELKPAHMQLAGVLLRRHEAADVCAPVRYSRQRGINRNRNMSLQRLPGRVHISGPKERSITLHAGLAVAMQRERPFLRTQLPRAFVIHSVASEP